MTIVVFDEHAVRFHRYASWLADSGEPLVGFTGARPSEHHPAYQQIQHISGYARSAALELAVVQLAARTDVTGIVATGFTDQLRAAGLREFLDIDGQHRAGALAAVDLVVQRDLLARAGIPVVSGSPVNHPSELCRHAHLIGFPVRLRRRRAVYWPTVARLDSETEMLTFLTDRRGGWRGLLTEPAAPGERLRIPTLKGVAVPLGRTNATQATVRAGAGRIERLVSAVSTALPDSTRWPLLIEAILDPTGTLLVDSVGSAVNDRSALRRAVRDQAGVTELVALS